MDRVECGERKCVKHQAEKEEANCVTSYSCTHRDDKYTHITRTQAAATAQRTGSQFMFYRPSRHKLHRKSFDGKFIVRWSPGHNSKTSRYRPTIVLAGIVNTYSMRGWYFSHWLGNRMEDAKWENQMPNECIGSGLSFKGYGLNSGLDVAQPL